ncbi:MAG: hypothetical protein ABL888_22665 [Pirellulaceae bacterium]
MPESYSFYRYGCLFLLAAIIAFAASWTPKGNKFSLLWIPFIFGTAYCFTTGLLGGWSLYSMHSKVWFVRNLANERVVTIKVLPGTISGKKNLFDKEVKVDNPNSIAAISRALREGTAWSPNHPEIEWQCRILIEGPNENAEVSVESTSNNGTLVTVHVKKFLQHRAVSVATYRSDGLKTVLENINDGR